MVDQCEHGDPRPGRCALCRQRVKVQTQPHRYADTTPKPVKAKRPRVRLTSAAVARREVAVWCATCMDFVTLAGNVYSTAIDAPVHVTPAEWTEHSQENHRER